jgi:hypothetical protein
MRQIGGSRTVYEGELLRSVRSGDCGDGDWSRIALSQLADDGRITASSP